MEGIIYKNLDYQESSKLLYVYTEKGKITLVAKGAHKANSDLRIISQNLNLIGFKGNESKTMYNIAEAKLINDYSFLKADIIKLKNVYIILEVIDKLIYDDLDHKKIYNELKNALESDIDYSCLTFLIRILFYLGYAPNLKGDGRKVKGMNAEEGGIVYQDENSYIDLDYSDTISFLELCRGYEYVKKIEKESKRKITEFLFKYFQYHLQTTLKALK